MGDGVYRVARSEFGAGQSNLIELSHMPRFAILETLETNDSDLFRSFLKQKKWEEVTPAKALKRKTYQNAPPEDGELEAYADVAPDWFYLSGHHGRGSVDIGKGKYKLLSLVPAPTGFFNEPFHKSEFETGRRELAPKGMFVQSESVESQSELDRIEKYLREQFAAEGDPDKFEEMVPYWLELLSKPTEDVTRPAYTDKKGEHPEEVVSARKGLFFANTWESVRVVITEACNTLVYNKDMYLKAFPNAITLGYIDKNPLDSTYHVKAFLANAFDGIKNADDPALLDHDHIAEAWMNLHFKQKLSYTARLAYMKPDGVVFGVADGNEFKPPATPLGGPHTYLSKQYGPKMLVRPMPAGIRTLTNEAVTKAIGYQTEPD